MKCLITGSNGFIGNNLLQAINKKYGFCFAFEEEDIKNITKWREHLEWMVKRCDCIFHVGAVSSTDASDINKTMFLNYEFSKILFDLAEKYNKKVVYSSSAAIYGKGDGIPCNLYAWTKKAGEDYGLLKVKNFVSLRYFNVYGPDETHKEKMASVALQAYLSNFLAKNLKGQKNYLFPLFPGGARRDFVYVDDVISANIFASENDVKSGVYEVGCGESRPFEDVLSLMGVKYFYLPEDVIPHWYQFETKSLRERYMLHWTPKFSLNDGIKKYKKYLDEKYESNNKH